jgi:hypothetical protein
MSWEYRVIHRCETLPGTVGVESVYAIHEVYYDEKGRPKMVSEDASPLQAESLQALNETRLLMTVACQKPVLEWHDIVPLETPPAEETMR